MKKEVVLITGVSSDIGKNIAINLAKQGYTIYGTYFKNEKAVEELNSLLIEINADFKIYKVDLTNYEDIVELIRKITEEVNQIDHLITLQAKSIISPIIDMEKEEIDELLDIDLKSVIYINKIVISNMLKKQTGNIINISSVWGNVGASCESIYSAAKAGINSLTKSLAKEYGNSNIRVNAIAPGYIETKMNSLLTEEEKMEILKEIPLKKFGTPENVSNVVNMLMQNKYITGQIITVDGGWTV